jgi:glutaredoxin
MNKITMNKDMLNKIFQSPKKVFADSENQVATVEEISFDSKIQEDSVATTSMIQIIPSLESYNIEVYTLSYCGWCNKVKAILNENDVNYVEHQLDDKSILSKTEELLYESKTEENHEEVLYVFDSLYKNPNILDNLEIITNGGKIDNEDDRSTSIGIGQYLTDHAEILPILDYFLDAKKEHEITVQNFVKFIEENHTGSFAPQISVNGHYFGSHAELTNCLEANGDFEHCLFDFTNKSSEIITL